MLSPQDSKGHDRAGEGMTNERLLPAKLIGCQALQGHRLHPFLVIPADCAGCLQESNECKQGMKTTKRSKYRRLFGAAPLTGLLDILRSL